MIFPLCFVHLYTCMYAYLKRAFLTFYNCYNSIFINIYNIIVFSINEYIAVVHLHLDDARRERMKRKETKIVYTNSGKELWGYRCPSAVAILSVTNDRSKSPLHDASSF